MVNFKIIFNILGSLLFLEALMLAVCLGAGFYFGEQHWETFGIPTFVAIALGLVLKIIGRRPKNKMGRRDGYLIVAVTWIVFSCIGVLPFLIGGHEPRLAAAFCEAMSGFTTTGASVIDHIEALPHSILLWRSMTQFLGGLGIVFFTIAVLPSMGAGDLKLFAAEATGLKMAKLHPRISTTARWLWTVYFLLTAVCFGVFHLCGMSLFDAANHAFSTIATGGFSTHTDGLAHFNSKAIDYSAAAFMLLSGINYTLLYLILIKGRLRTALRDGELRCFLFICFTCVAIVATCLFFFKDYDMERAFRTALFQVVSLQSTTGFVMENYMLWGVIPCVLLLFVTWTGACGGSTAGGTKCIRVLTSSKLIAGEFRRMLHPRAVLPVRIGKNVIPETTARTIYAFMLVSTLIIAISSLLLVMMNVPLLDALGLSVTALSNVGPALGHITGPTASWASLPDAALWQLSIVMLIGRLEIFSLLLPFVPSFWKNN